MGWRELRNWLRELNRAVAAERGDAKTAPDSWDGYENDAWFAQQREKHRQLRGR
jgi:hypothetical protein